ncbi:MAG: hypothetical protein ACK5X3_09230 [Pseudomonadota bacterium]
MDLKALLHAGVATRKPIAREFEFEGEPITAFFLDLPALEVRNILSAENRDALLVSSVVCDSAGAPIFSVEEAAALRTVPLNVLTREALSAVGALKEGKDSAKKPSEPTPS